MCVWICTHLSVLIPCEFGGGNGLGLTLQGQGVVDLDLHLLLGEALCVMVFADDRGNCMGYTGSHFMVNRWQV